MKETMEQTTGFDEAALDSAWAEEGDSWEPGDGAGTGLEHQQGGEQTPENPPAAPDAEGAPKGQEGGQNQPGEQPENQPELFTIQYNGRQEQLTKEQLITMAQKGHDYERVRQERDQLRQYWKRTGRAVDYLEEQARLSGMDLAGYLEALQRRELVRTGMSEQEAAREVQLRRREEQVQKERAEIDAYNQQKNSAQQQAQEREGKVREDIASFLKAYPQVKPGEIPKEVWDRVKGGESLVSAYAMHENQRYRAEMEKYQAEIEALKQNQANAQRSPGSLGGSAGAELDEIDRLWADDD